MRCRDTAMMLLRAEEKLPTVRTFDKLIVLSFDSAR